MMRTATVGLLVLGVGCAGESGAVVFTDVADEVGLAFSNPYGDTWAGGIQTRLMQRNLGNGVAVGDYDGDGDYDVYLLGNAGFPNALYRNNVAQGETSFTEVTSHAGVANFGLSRVAHFADLDNDGDLDLLVINDAGDQQPPSTIYENLGDGTFRDAGGAAGIDLEGYARCGAAIADYDQDGLLDIYVTNWSGEAGRGTSLLPGSNRLLRNLGDLTFADTTEQSGLGELARDSMTAVFTDFDGDHYPDLYVAVDHTPDEFYANRGGVFERVSEQAATTHRGNDMGAACADYDDDGDLDIYTTNITDPTDRFGSGSSGNVLYANQLADTGRLAFRDTAEQARAVDTFWGWGVEFFDVENDGDLDIIAATGFGEFLREVAPGSPLIDTPTVLFVNDGTGRYDAPAIDGLGAPDDSRALVAFDFDLDGDQDVLLTNVNQPVRLLENRTERSGHWLAVQVSQAAGSNRMGVGVTAFATVDGVTKRRDIIVGTSYLSGAPAVMHFGLGSADLVDELRVEWTDGTTYVERDVPADRILTISQ